MAEAAAYTKAQAAVPGFVTVVNTAADTEFAAVGNTAAAWCRTAEYLAETKAVAADNVALEVYRHSMMVASVDSLAGADRGY